MVQFDRPNRISYYSLAGTCTISKISLMYENEMGHVTLAMPSLPLS